MINPNELRLKNIRKHGKRFAVRFTRRSKTLSQAKKMKRAFNKYIDNVGVYEDTKRKTFYVQTYKEYENLEDAIKIRDFLKSCKELN